MVVLHAKHVPIGSARAVPREPINQLWSDDTSAHLRLSLLSAASSVESRWWVLRGGWMILALLPGCSRGKSTSHDPPVSTRVAWPGTYPQPLGQVSPSLYILTYVQTYILVSVARCRGRAILLVPINPAIATSYSCALSTPVACL